MQIIIWKNILKNISWNMKKLPDKTLENIRKTHNIKAATVDE